MVTILPKRPAIPRLACTWRFSETFWPDLPAACGLDAKAARLLRYGLTLAVEQMLDKRHAPAAPLPPPCSLRRVHQRRFDPTVVHWERRDEVQSLLQTEVWLTLGLVRRPLGKQRAEQWAILLTQQCARIGCLYQALARRAGQQTAISDLALALSACLQA